MFQHFRSFFARYPNIDGNTFLLWEPCSASHREILPGFASYLLHLGYRVVVICAPSPNDQGLFDRLTHPNLEHVYLPRWRVRQLFSSPDITQAAGVMITTAGKLPKRQDGYYDLDRLFPAGRSRCLAVVEHDAAKLIACNQWNPHIITLRKVNGCDANSVVVNPHRFGSVQNHPKGQVPQFLVVGAARSARRNQNMIYDAVRRLHGRGLTNFAVRVVGKLGGEPIPADLSTAINMLGPVSFSRLYQEAEQSDFILTSFQENNADHAFYRTTGTSGAFQLAYGFHRPMILQKSFAEGTPLNSDNALFYGSDDQLFDAMLTAIEMSQADYAHMQTNLTGAVDALWSESLENLRTYINEYSDRFLFR